LTGKKKNKKIAIAFPQLKAVVNAA